MIMIKLFFIPTLFQMMMFSGCHSGQQASGNQDEVAGLVLNGKVLELSTEKNKELANLVMRFMEGSDDFYELLVTDNLIASLRTSNECLEVRFPSARTVVTEKFGELEVSQVLIPLSGRYANNDQLTFFSGSGDFSNTPLLRSSGLAELLKMVGR